MVGIGNLIRAGSALLLLCGLAACGTSGAPRIAQDSGQLDTPCPALATPGAAHPGAVPTPAPSIAAANAATSQTCTAHVVLLNSGGRGTGVATVLVPLVSADGKPAAPAFCHAVMPDTPSGAYVAVSCGVSIPGGMSVTDLPRLNGAAVSAARDTSGNTDTLAIAVIVLALATAAVAATTLWIVVGARRSTGAAK